MVINLFRNGVNGIYLSDEIDPWNLLKVWSDVVKFIASVSIILLIVVIVLWIVSMKDVDRSFLGER